MLFFTHFSSKVWNYDGNAVSLQQLTLTKILNIMKKLSYFALSLVAICLFSCGGQSKDKDAQVDSLETSLEQRNADYQQLEEFLTIVASGLDSISMQETQLFMPNAESPAPSQERIKAQLANLKETVKTQRERIADLEKQLNLSAGNGKKLNLIITSLKTQLAEKEAQIASLQEEVNDKNITIDGLRSYMSQLTHQNMQQQGVIETQSQTIQEQDTKLNEGYVIMAKKSVLKEAGLLKGGFLKKSKVDFNTLDKNYATTIDIRQDTNIEIDSKKAKVLSQMPEDAYNIEQKGNKCILHITNVERFWSITRYLIIQMD